MTSTAAGADRPGSARPAGRGRGRLLRRLLSAALLLLAGFFLFRTAGDVGWRVLRQRLLGASPALLALTMLLTFLRYSVWAGRWQLLSRPVSPVPWWPAARGLMASLFFTTVVPGSRPFGGLIRAGYLGRAVGRPAAPFYGTAVVDQFGYGTVSMSLGAVFLPFAFWGGPSGSGGNRWLLAVAGAGMAAAFLLAWLRRDSIVARIRRRTPGVAETVEGAVGAAGKVLARPSSWLILAAGGTAVWWTNVATYQLAALALGGSLSFSAAAAAFSLGSLAGTVTGTPGGAGTTEFAALAPLTALGVEPELALPTVFLARGVHYLCSLGIGGACALLGGRPGRELPPLP